MKNKPNRVTPPRTNNMDTQIYYNKIIIIEER